MNADEYIVLNNNNNESITNDKQTNNIDPLLLSKDLQRLMLRLKGENLIDDKLINYESLAKNTLFQNDYLNLTQQLKLIDLDKLIHPVKKDSNLLAFFISIYYYYFYYEYINIYNIINIYYFEKIFIMH
jgi:hypothetical protein